ncbi:MAG: outer membrane protein transport protein [Sandaracinaceae bacterium]|nr:outer membrane protein transport protein [Sandaracinaceae bacterium]
MKRWLFLLGFCLLAFPSQAKGGGFYLLERGVRALGRGGAQIASAEDPSLWLNPAGLVQAPPNKRESLLLDGTLTLLETRFRRIDSGGRTLPEVSGQALPLPIPTVAGSFDFGLPDWAFGIGFFAPNSSLLEWPASISTQEGEGPAPQRYSVISLRGSLISGAALGLAWRPLPELSLGLAGTLIYASFGATTTISACDGVICSFPEDPDHDALVRLELNPVFTGTASLGLIWDPGPVRLGASLTTPYALSGRARIFVRMPSAPAFEAAFARSREGNCANVSDEQIEAARSQGQSHPCEATHADFHLDFPWILRAGLALDAIENFTLELAFVWESWSVQREATIRPRDVWMSNAIGFLDYEVGPLSIPRGMQDTVSVRLGGEYRFQAFEVRAGAYFETGAFPDEYLHPLTIDSDKIVGAVGGSFWPSREIAFDLLLGYAHLFPRSVRNSKVPQANPIRPPSSSPVFIGNGDYVMSAPFFGAGLRWYPDASSSEPSSPPPPSPPPLPPPSQESPQETPHETPHEDKSTPPPPLDESASPPQSQPSPPRLRRKKAK